MTLNQDQIPNFRNQGYLGFRGGDDEINPKYIGICGGDDEIKSRGSNQLGGFPVSNFNNRFDVGESRLAKIKAKISVEDFDYLKGFANSNKRIDEDDPRLVKIRAKISEEDANYLKGLANKRFGVNNTGFAKMNGRMANSIGPRFFDNNVGTKIRANISEEDAGFANSDSNIRFGANPPNVLFMDNNVGTISMCKIL